MQDESGRSIPRQKLRPSIWLASGALVLSAVTPFIKWFDRFGSSFPGGWPLKWAVAFVLPDLWEPILITVGVFLLAKGANREAVGLLAGIGLYEALVVITVVLVFNLHQLEFYLFLLLHLALAVTLLASAKLALRAIREPTEPVPSHPADP